MKTKYIVIIQTTKAITEVRVGSLEIAKELVQTAKSSFGSAAHTMVVLN